MTQQTEWKLVPVEPTTGMLKALTASWGDEGQTFTTKWALGSFREDYQAMLAAAPVRAALGERAEPKVKALEWHRQRRDDIERYTTDPPFAEYIITWTASGYDLYCCFWGSGGARLGPFAKLEAAKAAAQADYESRILSAISREEMGEPRDVEALVAELRGGLDKLPKVLWQAEIEWPELPSGYVAAHVARCSPENIAALLDALASERSRADRLEKALTEVRPCILGYIDRCDYTKGHAALAIVDAALSADGGSRG